MSSFKEKIESKTRIDNIKVSFLKIIGEHAFKEPDLTENEVISALIYVMNDINKNQIRQEQDG